MNWLRKLLGLKPYDPWEYGTCNGIRARRHRRNKNVQMVLRKAGQHDHTEDYWYNFASSWWREFTPDKDADQWIAWNPINPPVHWELLDLKIGDKEIKGYFSSNKFRFADENYSSLTCVTAWRYHIVNKNRDQKSNK